MRDARNVPDSIKQADGMQLASIRCSQSLGRTSGSAEVPSEAIHPGYRHDIASDSVSVVEILRENPQYPRAFIGRSTRPAMWLVSSCSAPTAEMSSRSAGQDSVFYDTISNVSAGSLAYTASGTEEAGLWGPRGPLGARGGSYRRRTMRGAWPRGRTSSILRLPPWEALWLVSIRWRAGERTSFVRFDGMDPTTFPCTSTSTRPAGTTIRPKC